LTLKTQPVVFLHILRVSQPLQPVVFNWRQNSTSTAFALWCTTDTTCIVLYWALLCR